MKLTNYCMPIAFVWFVVATLACASYSVYDWYSSVYEYEKNYAKYRADEKRFKSMFRRVPSPNVIWNFKYLNDETKNEFTQTEIKCLQDKEVCDETLRKQLCKRLTSFANISDCKSIIDIRNEYIAVNRYMDYQVPPRKPAWINFVEEQKAALPMYAGIILIPSLLLLFVCKNFKN